MQLRLIHTVPNAEDVLVRTHANRAPAYLRPSDIVWRCDTGKLVADESEDEVLPDAIGDAFAKAENRLSAREVEGVFPHGATDALVEEEVVCRREEGRGWMEVGPEAASCWFEDQHHDELSSSVSCEGSPLHQTHVRVFRSNAK